MAQQFRKKGDRVMPDLRTSPSEDLVGGDAPLSSDDAARFVKPELAKPKAFLRFT